MRDDLKPDVDRVAAYMAASTQPDPDVEFYAKALKVLAKPSPPTTAWEYFVRVLKVVYWFAVVLIVAWFVSQFLDRTKPVDTYFAEAVGPTTPGSPVRIHFKVHRYKRCDLEMDWAIIDNEGEIHRYSKRDMHSASNKRDDDIVMPFTVGPRVAVGPATLNLTIRYRCPGNYLEGYFPYVVDLDPIAFDVVSGGPGERRDNQP